MHTRGQFSSRRNSLRLAALVLAVACDPLDDFRVDGGACVGAARGCENPSEKTPTREWLDEHRGGWCAKNYNAMMNLCGAVDFCFDPRVMRAYPRGLAIDVAFHWDGEYGTLLDLGGDCDGKRVELAIVPENVIAAGNFLGSTPLRATITKGSHLVSFRADMNASSLLLDGELVESGVGTSTTPELLGACGPGFVLGQRLSYWWEFDKRSTWLRNAAFFVHLRENAGDVDAFDLDEVIAPGPDTVALFLPEDARGLVWPSHDGSLVGTSTGGATFVEDIVTQCLTGNRAPSAPSVRIEPLAPIAGEALECKIITPAMDPEGATVSYLLQWTRENDLTGYASDRLPAGVTRPFETWSCMATPFDGVHTGIFGAASVRVHAEEPCHQLVLTSTDASMTFSSTGYDLGFGPWTFETWLEPRTSTSSPTRAEREFVFMFNEDYAEHALTLLYEPARGVVICKTYGVSGGDPALSVEGRRIDGGGWHHVACVFANGVLEVFTDGEHGQSAQGSAELHATSNMVIGVPMSRLGAAAAFQGAIGPFRMSRSARYSQAFLPEQSWMIDAFTVSQHLVSSGLVGDVLIDQAGGDNDGALRSGMTGADAMSCE